MSTSETFVEKRDKPQQPERKQTDKGLMYISTPREIDQLIRTIPRGKLVTTKWIATQLTKKHKTDWTCQLTTGIFFAICANAAEEERLQGKTDIAPYWRVVKPKGRLYDKYLGRLLPQQELLAEEGFRFVVGKDEDTTVVERSESYQLSE